MVRIIGLIVALFASTVVASAAEPNALSADQRRERVRTIRAMIEPLAMRIGAKDTAQPLKLAAEPSLLYADNERELSDASLWVWELDGRPAGLSAVELRPKERTGGVWSFECASLTPAELRIELPAGEWTMSAGAVSLQRLPDAPSPAKARGQRLLQLRKLADRFTATAYSDKQGRIELRRLAAPVYRQAETAAGDGALFVFANGTNPEALLLLQLDVETNAWTYAFARLSGDASSANLDDREVFRVERYTGPDAQAAYINGKLRTEPLS